MNHSDLVKCAGAWLANSQKCSVVITEMSSTSAETPDAIGWQGARSIVVECKTSRADFLADGKKHFRAQPDLGMGRQRYFLTVPGLLKAEELPAGWGLLELTGSRVRMVRMSEPFGCNHNAETWLLLSALRRCGPLAPKGCSVKFYVLETQGRATLGVILPESQEVTA